MWEVSVSAVGCARVQGNCVKKDTHKHTHTHTGRHAHTQRQSHILNVNCEPKPDEVSGGGKKERQGTMEG